MPRKAPMIMQLEDDLLQARVAREEFVRAYCQHLPPTYAALIPLTDQAEILIEWKKHLEATFAADVEAANCPWVKNSDPKTRFIDWEGVSAADRMWIGSSGVEVAPGVPLVRFGNGVDPADGVRKPFDQFAEVVAARDEAMKRDGVAALVKFRAEYGTLTNQLAAGSKHKFNSPDAAKAARRRREELSGLIKSLESQIYRK